MWIGILWNPIQKTTESNAMITKLKIAKSIRFVIKTLWWLLGISVGVGVIILLGMWLAFHPVSFFWVMAPVGVGAIITGLTLLHFWSDTVIAENALQERIEDYQNKYGVAPEKYLSDRTNTFQYILDKEPGAAKRYLSRA